MRVGTVVAIYPERGTARVQFKELDGYITYELPVIQRKTHRDKEYWMPDVGEMVVVEFFEDSDVHGVILGAIYNQQDMPPTSTINKHVQVYEDGTRIEYDRQNHKLTIDIPQGEVHISVQNGNGNVYINGNLIVSKEIYDFGQTKGSLNDLRQTYNSHTHTGDSGGTTSTPNQTIGG